MEKLCTIINMHNYQQCMETLDQVGEMSEAIYPNFTDCTSGRN